MNQQKAAAFKDKYGPWAIVTGASSGIGRAITTELAAKGLNLVLVARRQTELEQVARHLSAQHGVETRVLAADLASVTALTQIESATKDLDVGLLVAAAGFGTAGDFMKAKLEDELAMLDVNCRAVMQLGLHFGKRFAERGRGGLILFGSLVGYQGTPHAAHYAATKAYVQTLAEALHVELAPKGVDVLSSAPGPVHSGFGARADMKMGAAEKPETVARATLNALGKKMTVTPGALSKFLTWSLMTAPRGLRVRIMGKIMGGMTRRSMPSRNRILASHNDAAARILVFSRSPSHSPRGLDFGDVDLAHVHHRGARAFGFRAASGHGFREHEGRDSMSFPQVPMTNLRCISN
jgi:short-subunit dehydrogenase